MSNSQHINPQKVAHNVASTFVEKYLSCVDRDEIFNEDKTGVSFKDSQILNNATWLYMHAYDAAFAIVSNDNSNLDED